MDSGLVSSLHDKETVWMKEAKEVMFEEAEEQTPGKRECQFCFIGNGSGVFAHMQRRSR